MLGSDDEKSHKKIDEKFMLFLCWNAGYSATKDG